MKLCYFLMQGPDGYLATLCNKDQQSTARDSIAQMQGMIDVSIVLEGELEIECPANGNYHESDDPRVQGLMSRVLESQQTGTLDITELEIMLKGH